MMQQQKPRGLLERLGVQKMEEGAEGEAGQRFYNRESFGDTLANLAPALGRMGVMGLDVPAQAVADRRFENKKEAAAEAKELSKRNKSMELLAGLDNSEELLRIAEIGGIPAALNYHIQSKQKASSGPDLTNDMQNWLGVKATNPDLTFERYLAEFKSPKGIQSKGVYRNSSTGEIIGEVNFNPATGQYFQLNENGEKESIDIKKYSPVLDSTFGQTVPNFTQFTKLGEELATDRSSIKTFEKYMRSIGDSNEGLARLADQFSTSAKTLLGGYFGEDYAKLSPSELNTKVAQGLLQGLIGRSRLEVVGGGVMTEQDALRIIQNLGGDVDLLQNKEIVSAQIKNLLEQKMSRFERNKKVHDNALFQIYGSQGYEAIEPYEVDMSVFNASPSVTFKNVPVGGIVNDNDGTQHEYLGGDRSVGTSWRKVE